MADNLIVKRLTVLIFCCVKNIEALFIQMITVIFTHFKL